MGGKVMNENALYILWLPKYFDEYYTIDEKEQKYGFMKKLKKFFKENEHIDNCNLVIYDKKVPKKFKNVDEVVMLNHEPNSIGSWGTISFTLKKSKRKGQVIFSEFGFYYFEFEGNEKELRQENEAIIQSFFAKEYSYPLLTETQEDVLKETFLNDNLDYKDFSRKKKETTIKIEDFILEAYYRVDENDLNLDGRTIQNKILKLTKNQYVVKKDEYFNFEILEKTSQKLQTLKDRIGIFFKNEKKYKIHDDMYKKVLLDAYEEKAISRFLTTVVSAKYFDRITKSIKVVREGLTGKIIYMTPQDTKEIDYRYKDNSVFKTWSEEKIENYVQLLISKKPLFTKIDNAMKSAYYITIGNVSSLGHINEKEDIAQLMYYHEWKSLLAYFSETTESLNNILNLYHSNRTYSELEEIKHYESNNHDKEDIELLIKSNENKLGSTEDSRTIMMMTAIIATAMVALPDMVGSVSVFPDSNISIGIEENLFEISVPHWVWAIIFYIISIVVPIFVFFGHNLKRIFKIANKSRRERKQKETIGYIKSSPDDFDILEHRSNMPVRTYQNDYYKKVSLTYSDHISTHRFVRHIEKLEINVNNEKSSDLYKILPEIVTIEGLKEKSEKFYEHIKENRTTKFSVNRLDKAKTKVTMRYRINKIKINDFLDYYEKNDSYINFYKSYCQDYNNKSYNKNCRKINSEIVIAELKKEFKDLDAELSFVAIYAFSLISKTLNHAHKKNFDLYKDSFRVYFHIDKYPKKYYENKFVLRSVLDEDEKDSLEPYDPLSEMIYLVFLGRLKGFNYEENIE
jgi:hypothetical protein